MNEPDSKDQDIAALLRLAGARDALPEDLKARWEAHVRGELARLRHRRRGRRGRLLALCASIAVLACGVFLLLDPGAPRDLPLADMRLLYGRGEFTVRPPGGAPAAMASGQAVAPGSELRVTPGGFVTLAYARHELRFNGGSHARLGAAAVTLMAGELYARDDPAATLATAPGLTIETPHGSIRDIGTQFIVAVLPQATEATVREGVIRVRSGDREVTVRATGDGARRSRLGPGGDIDVTAAAGRGRDWKWIHEASPPFVIDGRTAHEFLVWAAREDGLALRYTSRDVERLARETLLRGNAHVTDPERAVEPVLAGTDLRATLTRPGELRIARVDG